MDSGRARPLPGVVQSMSEHVVYSCIHVFIHLYIDFDILMS